MMVKLAVALLCAALSGMGVGGGGLLLIYLTLFENAAQRDAQMCNLLFFMAASASAMIFHIKERKMSMETVIFLSLGGIPGAVLGCALSRAAGDAMLRLIFGCFLLVSGVLSFFGGKSGKKTAK